MSVIILIVTSSYFCNLIYVTYQPKQWQKVIFWQKSLLYRILKNQLVIYILTSITKPSETEESFSR